MWPERFGDPGGFWFSAALLAGLLVVVAGWLAARATLRRWLTADDAARLTATVSWARRWLRAALMLAAAVLLGAAAARPQYDPVPVETERRGREVVFLVDVSRSMLAEDLAPNRLARAKLWIEDLVATLGGDRVGLVAFAGAASVKSPLTIDRGFFRMQLSELGPDSAPRGGTLLGDAIRKTLAEVFPVDEDGRSEGDAFRDIVLITDGDDQESFPLEAAQAARARGIRLIVLGLGASGEGAVVPAEGDGGGVMMYEGAPVRSSRNDELLAAMATATPGGRYFDVGTGNIDLERVYSDLVRSAEQTAFGRAESLRWRELYQWPLLAAVLLLIAESLVGDRRRVRGGGVA